MSKQRERVAAEVELDPIDAALAEARAAKAKLVKDTSDAAKRQDEMVTAQEAKADADKTVEASKADLEAKRAALIEKINADLSIAPPAPPA